MSGYECRRPHTARRSLALLRDGAHAGAAVCSWDRRRPRWSRGYDDAGSEVGDGSTATAAVAGLTGRAHAGPRRLFNGLAVSGQAMAAGLSVYVVYIGNGWSMRAAGRSTCGNATRRCLAVAARPGCCGAGWRGMSMWKPNFEVDSGCMLQAPFRLTATLSPERLCCRKARNLTSPAAACGRAPGSRADAAKLTRSLSLRCQSCAVSW